MNTTEMTFGRGVLWHRDWLDRLGNGGNGIWISIPGLTLSGWNGTDLAVSSGAGGYCYRFFNFHFFLAFSWGNIISLYPV